jgi:hypothetical protein
LEFKAVTLLGVGSESLKQCRDKLEGARIPDRVDFVKRFNRLLGRKKKIARALVGIPRLKQ